MAKYIDREEVIERINKLFTKNSDGSVATNDYNSGINAAKVEIGFITSVSDTPLYGGLRMNEKLIPKAVECYVEKLEKENALLKKALRRIASNFGSNAKGRTERELLDDVLEDVIYYYDIIKED